MVAGQDHTLGSLNLDQIRLKLSSNKQASHENIRAQHNAQIKVRDVKAGGASLIPNQSQLSVTRQAPLEMPDLVMARGNQVQNYRKPIMKEKGTI